jgi:hypothetical protein
MFTKTFWKQAAERAVKTAAQGAILALGGDAANVLHANVWVVLGAAGGGALLSLLTSLVTSGTGEKDSPSAVNITK